MKTLELNRMSQIEGSNCFFAALEVTALCLSPQGILTGLCAGALKKAEACLNGD